MKFKATIYIECDTEEQAEEYIDYLEQTACYDAQELGVKFKGCSLPIEIK